MTNKITLTFLFTALSLMAIAQQPKLSPHSKQIIYRASKQASADVSSLYKTGIDGDTYYGALLKISNPIVAEQSLKRIGAHIGTRAGSVWSVKIPVAKLALVGELSGISYVELDEPVKPQMSVVRTDTRVDSVQNGIGLNTKLSGKGIIVGVIDFGFDYNHPAFYDTSGSYIRVKKVWEQGGVGTPPQGYNYGRELADTNAIKNATTDNNKQSHGTNVAGVAAGSGVGSPLFGRRHRGIAYDAELVFVCVRRDSIEQQWKQGGFSDFVDAVSYIFNYANEVQKPCIINISWGSHSGPHNGTTLLNEAFDNMTGAGRIIAMSAGNDGEDLIHLSKTFSISDTAMHTFLSFTNTDYHRTWADAWGEEGKSFCMKVSLFKDDSIKHESPLVCTNDTFFVHQLINAQGDTCLIEFNSSSAEYNGQTRITADIFNKSQDSILVSFYGNDGKIHTWNEYYYYGYDRGFKSEYTSFNKPWATTGNNETTVSDMGSGKQILLIGAHASKTSFRNLAGQTLSYESYVQSGNITPFSSRGPLTDGRIKPDISAPGLTMASPCSSYDPAYLPSGARSDLLVNKYTHPVTNRVYYYSEFTGTSASSPVASGIVALMLQASPQMFPFHVRNIFAETAMEDSKTGQLPAEGNNTWGFGKINAYAAVKGAIQVLGVQKISGKKLHATLYPNPVANDESTTIHFKSEMAENILFELYDINGKLIQQEDWYCQYGLNEKVITLNGYQTGLYVVRLQSVSGALSMKLMIQ